MGQTPDDRSVVSSTAKQGGMPTWAKVLIGVAIVAVIGTIALVTLAGALFVNLGKGATDPHASEKVAHQIVVFDGDLPPDWKYTMNMDLFTLKMVAIMNMKDKTMVNIMQIPNPKHQSANEMTSAPSLEQRKYGNTNFSVEGRGEDTIGGEKVPYVRGHTADGKELQMGFVVLPTGKAIMIQVIEPHGPYDPALAQPVLDKIKGYVAS